MASFEERMQSACQDGSIAGAVVMATNASGSFSYQNAFGKSDKPYQLDSPMKIMSCSKIVTSVCVLQCVEKGLIGLDDDVSRHLPSLAQWKVLVECEDGKEPMLQELERPITLRFLITHSSGTVSGIRPPKIQRYRERVNTAHLLFGAKTIEERYGCPLAFQPGTEFEYGPGHDWAGKVVEALTGTDLDSYIKANISPQLGITSMTFWPQKYGILSSIPEGVVRKGSGALKAFLVGGTDDPNAELVPFPDWDAKEKGDCQGGSGLTSSTPDFLKVIHSLLANDGKILKRETVNQIFIPTLTPEAKKSFNTAWLADGFQAAGPGEYAADVEVDWGLGAMLTLQDSPGWRGKGTLLWSGMANHFWFIDRQNDLCGVFATQLLPSGDDRTKKVITMWEKEMQRMAAAFAGKS